MTAQPERSPAQDTGTVESTNTTISVLQRVARRIDRWLLEPASPERLAVLRIVIGAFVVVWLIASVGEARRLTAGSPAAFEPVGLARLLDGPVPDTTLWVGFILLIVAGALFVAGIGFRVIGPLFAIGVLAWTSYHSSWGQLLHFEHLFTIHVAVIGLAPAADVLSVSSRCAATPGDDIVPALRYGWPVRLLMIATVATYVLSGIAKLRLTGLSWFGTDVLADHIAYSATRIERIGGPTPPLAAPVLANTWAIPAMATAAMIVELGAPVALVGRRLRNWWVGSAIGFHAATGLTMWVFFGYRGLGIGLLPLFAVERALSRSWWPRLGSNGHRVP